MYERPNIRERDTGFITPEGIKRIVRDRDLSASERSLDVYQSVENKRKQLHFDVVDGCIMALVMVKNGAVDNRDADVLYAARYLAQEYTNHSVVALVCGVTSVDFGAMGADSIITINYDLARDHNPDTLAKRIAELLVQHNAKHLIGAQSDWGDADILRRTAIHADCTFTAEVIAIEDTHDVDNAVDQQQSPRVFGKMLVSYIDQHCEAISPCTTIFAIRDALGSSKLHSAWQVNQLARYDIEQHTMQPTTTLPPSQIALTEATFICSAGNGVEDMALFTRCADSLGAVVGASRVVTDAGRLPRDRQVGATGVSVVAQVYLCFGISGAIQHLQGIRDCNLVIAVNTDSSCPIMQRADFAFVADAGEVMQAIIAILDA